MSKLEWRSIGPWIGGRVVDVAGVPNDRSINAAMIERDALQAARIRANLSAEIGLAYQKPTTAEHAVFGDLRASVVAGEQKLGSAVKAAHALTHE